MLHQMSNLTRNDLFHDPRSQTVRTRPATFNEVENNLTLITYAILISFGLITNAFIIHVIFTNRLKTKFCRFLFHLALIDIGQCIGLLPYLTIDLYMSHKYNKYFESFLCSVTDGHSSMLIFSIAASFLLTFMSILRCEAMIKPFLKIINDQNINKVFLFSWLVGGFFFIPYMLSYRLDHQVGLCFRDWIISKYFGTVYMTFISTCGMLAPLTAMITACTISYINIYKKHSMGNTRGVVNSIGKVRSQIIIRLISLTSIFIVSWSPYSVYWILTCTIYDVNEVEEQITRLKILRYVLIPTLLGHIVGPLLNAYYWKPFRNALKYYFKRNRLDRNRRGGNTTYYIRNRIDELTSVSK